MADEPTRKELNEQLATERAQNAEMSARLARLEQQVAAIPPPETDAQRLVREKRLADAEAELAELRPGAARVLDKPKGPAPTLVPYKGWVRATKDCAYGCYRFGPDPDKGRQYGDVFEIDVPTLWSDDPWEPVIPSWDEGGNLVQVKLRRDVTAVDYRFRPRAVDWGLLAANQI